MQIKFTEADWGEESYKECISTVLVHETTV